MLTEIVKIRLERLIGQRPSRVCTIPDCRKPPKAGMSLCFAHYNAFQYNGVAGVPILSRVQRRPYVCAVRAVLTQAYVVGDDPTVAEAVNQLASWIEREGTARTYRPSDLGARRGIPAPVKVCSIVHAIWTRFHHDSIVTALALLSMSLGTALCCAHEPGVCRSPAFARAATFRAVWGLVLLPGLHRPPLAGPWIHKATQKLLIKPYVPYLLEDKALTTAVLERIMTHTYQYVDWSAWARLTHQKLTQQQTKGTRTHEPSR